LGWWIGRKAKAPVGLPFSHCLCKEYTGFEGRGYPVITVRGESRQWRDGLTVEKVLEEAGFRGRLVYVRVNGRRVGPSQWETFPVPDGASVEILPVVLGG
jgi:thiamine biosynthesis protein ThiS